MFTPLAAQLRSNCLIYLLLIQQCHSSLLPLNRDIEGVRDACVEGVTLTARSFVVISILSSVLLYILTSVITTTIVFLHSPMLVPFPPFLSMYDRSSINTTRVRRRVVVSPVRSLILMLLLRWWKMPNSAIIIIALRRNR